MLAVNSCFMICCFLLFSGSGPALAANWIPLPDTGQTKCYNIAGAEIACPAEGESLYGQDAQYSGTAPSYTSQTIGNDQIVLDNNTGLTWQQNTADTNGNGSITLYTYPTGDIMTWQEAVDYCADLSFAGSSDWRLPSYTELESIVDYGRDTPSINETYFQCLARAYWSATTHAGYATYAWTINFLYGREIEASKTGHILVRCVRGEL